MFFKNILSIIKINKIIKQIILKKSKIIILKKYAHFTV